ncbi:hypothetical protein INS49_014986 [Diaporthe citri]|uniref:uncharacterized protein n=1 Tax=Diaporthe citri TaxID=83186 RepID=UPI001C82238B|nr:uncharacterized protein INS49_014986 [Diaporthe citri]KAG6357109.1 hypothetical protein INS49_014986 [Diaporthe citri]
MSDNRDNRDNRGSGDKGDKPRRSGRIEQAQRQGAPNYNLNRAYNQQSGQASQGGQGQGNNPQQRGQPSGSGQAQGNNPQRGGFDVVPHPMPAVAQVLSPVVAGALTLAVGTALMMAAALALTMAAAGTLLDLDQPDLSHRNPEINLSPMCTSEEAEAISDPSRLGPLDPVALRFSTRHHLFFRVTSLLPVTYREPDPLDLASKL